jgi:hypothetical protein
MLVRPRCRVAIDDGRAERLVVSVESTATITLKTMVPLGTQAVPLFQVVGETDESFRSDINAHDVVSDINVVNEHDDTVLYALDWDVATDTFLDRIRSNGGSS